MMNTTMGKPPPRYVPTLTDVVAEPQAQLPGHAQPAVLPAVTVPPSIDVVPGLEAAMDAAQAPWQPSAQALVQAEELLVQRLLGDVERVLEQRLQEALAQVLQEQTLSLTVRLQEVLESVVRRTLHEAIDAGRPAADAAAGAAGKRP